MPNVYDSLKTWIRKTQEKCGQEIGNMTKQQIEDKAYEAYGEYLPAEVQQLKNNGNNHLTVNGKERYEEVLSTTQDNYSELINISGQAHHNQPLQAALDDGTTDFGFYLKYTNTVNYGTNDFPHCRITISFDFKKSDEVVALLGDYLNEIKDGEDGKAIDSIKILGPDYQGTRTDNAIIYVNNSDPKILSKIQEDLAQKFAEDNITLYNHAPYGMKGLITGFSMSNVGPYRTSHGRARSHIIAKVVKELDKNDGRSLDAILKNTLIENGYDPDNPEKLDLLNYLEHYDSIEGSMEERRNVVKGTLESNPIYENQIGNSKEVYDREDYIIRAKNVKQAVLDIESKSFTVIQMAMVNKLESLFGKKNIPDELKAKFVEHLDSTYDEAMYKENITMLKNKITTKEMQLASAADKETLTKEINELKSKVNTIEQEIVKVKQKGKELRQLVGRIRIEELRKKELAMEQYKQKLNDQQMNNGNDVGIIGLQNDNQLILESEEDLEDDQIAKASASEKDKVSADKVQSDKIKKRRNSKLKK